MTSPKNFGLAKGSQVFYLPTLNTVLTAIPKTGSTSLKKYLFSLEEAASGNLEAALRIGAESGLRVHSDEVSYKHLVSSKASWCGKTESPLQLVVVRNPVDRTISAWLNKFLFIPSRSREYLEYLGESFIPVSFQRGEFEIRHCLEQFVSRLETDHEFLHRDPHWTPQSSLIDKRESFDVVIQTQDLDALPQMLFDHPKFLASAPHLKNVLKDHKIGRENSSNPGFINALSYPSLVDRIESVYAEDFELFKQLGISQSTKYSSLKLSDFDLNAELEKVSGEILERRVAFLTENLSQIRNSKTWKLTAPIRNARTWKLTAAIRKIRRFFR